MSDSCGLFGSNDVACRGLEEVQHGCFLERRRVGDVDDSLRTVEGFRESCACENVHASRKARLQSPHGLWL